MRPIPQPLKIVAWLFIASGILAIIEVIVSLMVGRIDINLGVLSIFVGQGLLQLNPRSYSWAMFGVWFGLIVSPLAALLFLVTPGQLKIFGVALGQAPPGLGFVICIAMFAMARWQYGVLTNPHVRPLFGKPSPII